ncbi:restriction endonuclease subunit S [Aliarcobacter butzleri]|nr:restriction endonuclease subunit S [Aliarcobacter butzleri]
MIDNLPNGWKVEKLGNIANYINGKAFKPTDWETQGLPIIRIQNLNGNDEYNYYDKEIEEKYLVKNNDILISWSASLGVYKWNKGKAVLNQHIFNTEIDSSKITDDFFYYTIKKALITILANLHGSTMKHITKGKFENIQILLPPLEQQEKIVKVLDLTSNLIEKQKELLKKYDLFLKSKFIEMFGDPITNPMGWEVVNFEDIMVLQRGYDLPINDRAYGNIEVYGSNGVLDYHSEAKVKNGGVITGRSGTLGKVHYTLGDYWPLNTTLFSKDLKGNNIIYLAYFLEMFKVERFSQGAGVPTLNRNLVHKEKTYKVPLELQNKFASIVKKIETIKEKENKKLKQMNDLHNSMMNKAFKGEIK